MIALVAGLTVKEIWINELECSKEDRVTLEAAKKAWLQKGPLFGDLMVMLGAIGSVSAFFGTGKSSSLKQICKKLCLRFRAIEEIQKLMKQLERCVKSAKPDFNLVYPIASVSSNQIDLLEQVIISAFGDRILRKRYDQTVKTGSNRSFVQYESMDFEEDVFIHSSSVFAKHSIKNSPDYILYQDITETTRKTSRNYASLVMGIKDISMVGQLSSGFCNFSQPVIDELKKETYPRYCKSSDQILCKVRCTFGKKAWVLEETTEVEYPTDFNALDKYRWFGRILLEGGIFKDLKKLEGNIGKGYFKKFENIISSIDFFKNSRYGDKSKYDNQNMGPKSRTYR